MYYNNNGNPSLPCVELEALGDDFLGEDEDSSYLDAVGAPDPPTTVPGDSGRVEVGHSGIGSYSHVVIFAVTRTPLKKTMHL